VKDLLAVVRDLIENGFPNLKARQRTKQKAWRTISFGKFHVKGMLYLL